MHNRVVLERRLFDESRPMLRGFVGAEAIMVELDNSARISLSGNDYPTMQKIVDESRERIALAAERLFDTQCFTSAKGQDGMCHILVSAIDLD